MMLLSFAQVLVQRLSFARTLVFALAVGLTAWLVLGKPAQADIFTWNGGGGSNDWGDGGNWTSIFAPPTGPPFNVEWEFLFTGNKATSNINEPWSVTRIEFVSGVTGMTFTGSTLTFLNEAGFGVAREGIVNNDNSTQTFSNSEIIFLNPVTPYSITAASGNLDFNAKLTVEEGGTLNVGGDNDVFLDGGIVRSNTNNLLTMTVNKSGTGELRLRDDSTGIEQLNISGGLVLLSQTNNPIINSALNVSVVNATFDLNGNNTNIDVLVGSGSVDLGSGRLIVGEAASEDASFTFNGVISGTGGITKDQDGEMVLGGSNTYTGLTSIDNGTLRLSGSGRISDESDVSIFGLATFDLNGVSDTVDSIQGAGTIRLGGGTLTVDETAGTRTFSGDILETGELEKNGAGSLILSGSNTFSLLDINAGAVRVSSAGNLGVGSIELSGGTLNTTASFTNNRQIIINSASTINVEVATTLTQTGPINGTSGFAKTGAGTLVLDDNNSFNGELFLSGGTLSVGASNNLGNVGTNMVFFGGTLQSTGSFTNPRDVFVGPFNSGTFNVNTSTTLIQSGAITGDSTTTLTKSGGGTFSTTGANAAAFSGDLVINGGTFVVNGGDVVLNSLSLQGGAIATATEFRAINGADVAVPFTWQIGVAAGEFGSTLVSGVNGAQRSTIRGTGGGAGADLVAGLNGTGSLTVLNGGLADLRDDFILGFGATGDGTAVVSGVNGAFRSTVEANNSGANSLVQIGRAGAGDLSISSGGLVTTSGDAFVGQLAGSTGTLTIGGSSGGLDATLDVADDIGIGGSAGSAGGTADVTISAGGLLQVGGTTQIWDDGTLTLNGGSVTTTDFFKTSGATFNLDGGTFEVSGGDSVFNSSLTYGGDEATAPEFRATGGADVAVEFSWQIGASGGEFGSTVISGVNGVRRSTIRGTGGGGGADLVVGLNGTGTLTVSDGGLADLRDDFILGNGSTGSGTVVVSGVNGAFRSTVEANNSGANSVVQIGRAGIGDLSISSGGLVTTSGDAFVGQLASSTGTLTIGGNSGGFDATLDVADDMGIGGTTSTAGGTGDVTITTGGLLQVGDALKLWGAGTVNLLGGTLDATTIDDTEGGTFNFTGGRLQVDTFTGSLINQGGTLAPGNSPGTTVITGNYDQLSGTLEIEINGLAAGTNFDFVSVAGIATLGGTLDISLIDGFVPTLGDTFEILTAGSVSGQFDVEMLPSSGGLFWNVNYGTTNVVLEVLSSFTADFDSDGDVDGDDLAQWQGDFGINDSSDADGDADSDGVDFLAWQRQFGSGGGMPLAAASTVPEPTSLLLAALGMLTLSVRRKRA